MSMKNLDLLEQEKLAAKQKLGDAMKSGDEAAFAEAFLTLAKNMEERVLGEARGLLDAADTSVLVSRGVRQLTSAEKIYYGKVLDAMKAPDVKTAMSGIDEVMPKTVIDSIFEDLQQNHPLLNKINFVNTTAITEFLVNVHEVQLAQWGPLTGEIVKEITSGFKKMDTGMYKLSAFLPMAKATLDLGPAWLDRYVRVILAEALAVGLEEAIINGTGKDMPIGMDRQVGDGVTVTGGVYPLRDVVAVKSLDPASYGALLADHLAKTSKGNPRAVSSVLMICNPVDYLKRVMPATTVQTPDGRFVNNVLPYPTDIVQSTQMEAGKAIFGIPSRYFMGVGMAKDGRIEYSDEYRFLEDERVYLIKTYANGQPKDNCSFVYADISGLEPLKYTVKVESPAAAGN